MKKLLCAMVAFMVMLAIPWTEAAFENCGQVVSFFVPCTKYLTSGGEVRAACCDSLKGLKAIIKTSYDIKLACVCIDNLYTSDPRIKSVYLEALPEECDLDIPFIISEDEDCDSVE
uniref:non-specific lipid-transfer protein 1-like isoform X2 n=1 Tax=Erigeron canadensis TaxID=72917 RepID=UPI001CB992D7|nr:non-specific lipid-transfer protein 1-like isoform X2 [Erigeron canadensis]